LLYLLLQLIFITLEILSSFPHGRYEKVCKKCFRKPTFFFQIKALHFVFKVRIKITHTTCIAIRIFYKKVISSSQLCQFSDLGQYKLSYDLLVGKLKTESYTTTKLNN